MYIHRRILPCSKLNKMRYEYSFLQSDLGNKLVYANVANVFGTTIHVCILEGESGCYWRHADQTQIRSMNLFILYVYALRLDRLIFSWRVC